MMLLVLLFVWFCGVNGFQTRWIVMDRRRLSSSKVSIHSVDEITWEAEVEKNSSPVLAFFTAPWCGPCRLVKPIISEIAGDYGPGTGVESSNILKVVVIDTDEVPPEMPEKFGVTSIPTLLLVKDGKMVDRIVGAVPKSALLTMLRNKFGLDIAGTV
mmetsp:Transcript_45896/g.92631  ORF Transcript_45896/g.92631 Transcript_45896/m.92631 type:complete len:157 (-) Transcript_45896:237-707(-)